MKGLAAGEQSSATNPVLQLFVRQGEFLVDPYEGTFLIEDVRNPSAAPSERVALTALDLNDVPTGHKLGTGRFVIPTGDTSGWAYGTHRAVCRYRMEAGGREYVQEILFEMLNPTLMVTGQGYVGYAATRDLYRDGYFSFASSCDSSSGTSPDSLHAHIRRISVMLEDVLSRFFEPRYLDLRISGDRRSVLFLNEAIIAIEDAALVQRESDDSETLTTYEHEGYSVFNRHLDGLENPDDRHNPLLKVRLDSIQGYTILGWKWPTGQRNISVKGVFGFTDPEPQSDGVLIGRTPDEFVQIIGVLASRHVEDATMSSLATWQPGKVKMYRTRDQQIQFYGASGNVNYGSGILGDPMLDQLLLRFVKPARLDYPDREEVTYLERL